MFEQLVGKLPVGIAVVDAQFQVIYLNDFFLNDFPKNIRISSIPKFIDLIITQAGFAGSEYPCLGIPVIVTSQSKFTGRGEGRNDHYGCSLGS